MSAPHLTDDDRRTIAAAIAEAERGTSGELYCILARRSADYREIPLALAAFAAFVPPLAALVLGWTPGWPAGWTVQTAAADPLAAVLAFAAVQAALFAIVGLVASIPALRLRLAPSWLKRGRVRQAAVELFMARGLQATAARTGVLIYASAAERRVEVVADETVHARVAPEVWAAPCAALAAHLARGETAAGFVEAVRLCGAVLADHAPPRPGPDVNELPDRVAEI